MSFHVKIESGRHYWPLLGVASGNLLLPFGSASVLTAASSRLHPTRLEHSTGQ